MLDVLELMSEELQILLYSQCAADDLNEINGGSPKI